MILSLYFYDNFPDLNYISFLNYKNTWVHRKKIFNIYFWMFVYAIVVNLICVGESIIIPLLFINLIYVIIPGIIHDFLFQRKKYI